MDLRQLADSARAANRIRRWHARTGRNLSGNLLWRDEEIDTLRRLYPDYKTAHERLRPTRTRNRGLWERDPALGYVGLKKPADRPPPRS